MPKQGPVKEWLRQQTDAAEEKRTLIHAAGRGERKIRVYLRKSASKNL
ncbi:MAG: hypothetical protein KF832_27490 [Caldilineaceae bacterium]|nr:hypothetical protein [Caldilineaceae bacterium]